MFDVIWQVEDSEYPHIEPCDTIGKALIYTGNLFRILNKKTCVDIQQRSCNEAGCSNPDCVSKTWHFNNYSEMEESQDAT